MFVLKPYFTCFNNEHLCLFLPSITKALKKQSYIDQKNLRVVKKTLSGIGRLFHSIKWYL